VKAGVVGDTMIETTKDSENIRHGEEKGPCWCNHYKASLSYHHSNTAPKQYQIQ